MIYKNSCCIKNCNYICEMPHSINRYFSIEIQNNGFFTAFAAISYLLNGQWISFKSHLLNYRDCYKTQLSSNANTITINVYNNTKPDIPICTKHYPVSKNIRILLWGTETANKCTEP